MNEWGYIYCSISWIKVYIKGIGGTILIIRSLNQEWSGDGFLFCPCMNDDIDEFILHTFYFQVKRTPIYACGEIGAQSPELDIQASAL